MNQDVILVNIMQEVVNSMTVAGVTKVYYFPGRSLQILQSLNNLDNSITYKSKKYPNVAMVLPVRENRGPGYYATTRIDRIVISTLTKTFDGSDQILDKYGVDGNYQTILYPCYYEFLRRLARSPHIIGNEPNWFPHTKIDNPGQQPIGQGSTDYIDSIEILNLELILNQIKTC